MSLRDCLALNLKDSPIKDQLLRTVDEDELVARTIAHMEDRKK